MKKKPIYTVGDPIFNSNNNSNTNKQYKKLITQQNFRTPVAFKNNYFNSDNNSSSNQKINNTPIVKNNNYDILPSYGGNRTPQQNKYYNNYNNYTTYTNIQPMQQNKDNNNSNNKSNISISPQEYINIDENIFKQFILIRELEKMEKIKDLKIENEKLNKENKKLTNNLLAKEKLDQDKILFYKEKAKILDNLRKKEEELLKIEDNIQNDFLKKKNEIKDMKLKLKEEQNNLYNNKQKMNNDYNYKLNELENDYKNKEKLQNENNMLNINKLKQEEELLREKQNHINQLQNYYMNIKNNLDVKENELKQKEIELNNKEFNINNKFNQLMQQEKNLLNEKNMMLANIQNKENDYNNISNELKNREEQLKNKEYQLIYLENSLNNKELDIRNKENEIYDQQNKLKNINNEINNKQNELKNKFNELSDKKINMNNLDKLNEEIELKKNKIMELNNEYNSIMENINHEKSKSNIKNNNNTFTNEMQNNPEINERPSITVKKIQRKFKGYNNNNQNENNNLSDFSLNRLPTLEEKVKDISLSSKNKDKKDNDSYPGKYGEDMLDNNNMANNNIKPDNQFIYNNDNYNKNNKNDISDIKNNNNISNDEEEYYDFDTIDNQDNQDNQYPKEQDNKYLYNSNRTNNNNLDENNNQLGYNNYNNNEKNKINEKIMKSTDTMNYNNVQDTGEMDLNDLHDEDYEIKDNNNNQNISNSINENENDYDLNEIKEELFIEEYNPSLGLTKQDNQKYMNAVLQCFAHIPEITDNIINLHVDPNYTNRYPKLLLSKAYRELLINLFLPNKVLNLVKLPYNAKKFINLTKNLNQNFQSDNNDYKEFIDFLMSKLHEELNINKNEDLNISGNSHKIIDIKNENDVLVDFLKNYTNKNNSVIVKNIYGIIKNVLYCHKCQNSFYNFYIYSYFNFNLSKIIEYKQSKYNNTNITLDIYDCLDYYQKAQTLLGDKAIFCPDCKEQTESTSLKNIYSTKNILIFIFENNKENIFTKNFFDYTEIINLRDYVEYKKDEKKSKEKYYLCGIVNFVEDNYGNETFIAFCKMGKNNDWCCYDNENIYPVTFQEIKNNGIPVVLFYHKIIRK